MNTNLVPGPVNTNWGPGSVNTNLEPGAGKYKEPGAGKYKYPLKTWLNYLDKRVVLQILNLDHELNAK